MTIRILKYVNDGKDRVAVESVSIWTTWLFTHTYVGATLDIPSPTRHCPNSRHLLWTTIKGLACLRIQPSMWLREWDGKTSWLWNTTSRFHSGANASYHMVLGPCWLQLSLCLVHVTFQPHSSYILVSARTWNVAWITTLSKYTTLKRDDLANTQWFLTVKSRIPAGLASSNRVSETVVL